MLEYRLYCRFRTPCLLSTVLAIDPFGAAVVLYKYGNGKIIFLSGYNMLSNGNVSPGATLTFPNDIFLCNLFASVFK